jgi:DNA-binding MarR family transcriptional regulator
MATPPLTGLGRLLREASTAFNKVFRMRLAPLGVTYGQFQYLQNLWEADGLTQTELTRRVGIEIASSTAILDSLEASKFIRRVRSPTDRRKIHVYLTPTGAAMEDALTACAIATNTTARHGLSNTEIASLFGGLRRIVENMRSASATDSEAEPAPARSKPPPRAARKALAR